MTTRPVGSSLPTLCRPSLRFVGDGDANDKSVAKVALARQCHHYHTLPKNDLLAA